MSDGFKGYPLSPVSVSASCFPDLAARTFQSSSSSATPACVQELYSLLTLMGSNDIIRLALAFEDDKKVHILVPDKSIELQTHLRSKSYRSEQEFTGIVRATLKGLKACHHHSKACWPLCMHMSVR